MNLDVTLPWRTMEKEPGGDCFSKHKNNAKWIVEWSRRLHHHHTSPSEGLVMLITCCKTQRDSRRLSITSQNGVDTWKRVDILTVCNLNYKCLTYLYLSWLVAFKYILLDGMQFTKKFKSYRIILSSHYLTLIIFQFQRSDENILPST